MAVCTFFGHRECYGLEEATLRQTVVDLIGQGVDTFYVGNQGQFDALVRKVLRQLQKDYPHIRYSVVLAYLPVEKREYEDMSDTVYPEGLETGPPKFAVDRRNRWMLSRADYCVCYINCTWGGAYKFARTAKHREKTVINLGSTQL